MRFRLGIHGLLAALTSTLGAQELEAPKPRTSHVVREGDLEDLLSKLNAGRSSWSVAPQPEHQGANEWMIRADLGGDSFNAVPFRVIFRGEKGRPEVDVEYEGEALLSWRSQALGLLARNKEIKPAEVGAMEVRERLRFRDPLIPGSWAYQTLLDLSNRNVAARFPDPRELCQNAMRIELHAAIYTVTYFEGGKRVVDQYQSGYRGSYLDYRREQSLNINVGELDQWALKVQWDLHVRWRNTVAQDQFRPILSQANLHPMLARGWFALALRDGWKELVDELLNQKLLLNSFEGEGEWAPTPLQAAAQWGDAALVLKLISEGADPDRGFYETPLVAAASSGNLGVVRTLLARGARLRPPSGDPEEDILAWRACAAGNVELLDALAKAGLNFDQSRFESTPLHAAAGNGRGSTVDWLLLRGVSLKSGVLSAAVDGGDAGCLRSLLKAGANPDDVDSISSGKSALAEAVARKRMDLVAILVDAGADPDFAPERGITARQVALEENMQAMLDLFKSAQPKKARLIK